MPLLTNGPSRLLGRRGTASNGLLANLIGYWALDEAAGANNALDKHSGGLTLTQTGSPGSDTGLVYAGARTFSGSGQYFSRTNETALELVNADWTIAAWIYPTNLVGARVVVAKDVAGAREFVIYIFSSKVSVNLFDGAGNVVFSGDNSTAISPNQWSLVTVQYAVTSGVVGIQVNGGTIVTKAQTATPAISTTSLTVGGRSYSGAEGYFAGRIAPLSLWKSAAGAGGVLSAAALTWLYNSGNGRTYASLSSYA